MGIVAMAKPHLATKKKRVQTSEKKGGGSLDPSLWIKRRPFV